MSMEFIYFKESNYKFSPYGWRLACLSTGNGATELVWTSKCLWEGGASKGHQCGLRPVLISSHLLNGLDAHSNSACGSPRSIEAARCSCTALPMQRTMRVCWKRGEVDTFNMRYQLGCANPPALPGFSYCISALWFGVWRVSPSHCWKHVLTERTPGVLPANCSEMASCFVGLFSAWLVCSLCLAEVVPYGANASMSVCVSAWPCDPRALLSAKQCSLIVHMNWGFFPLFPSLFFFFSPNLPSIRTQQQTPQAAWGEVGGEYFRDYALCVLSLANLWYQDLV